MTPLPRYDRTLVAQGVERALYQWRNGSHTLKGRPVPWCGPTAEELK